MVNDATSTTTTTTTTTAILLLLLLLLIIIIIIMIIYVGLARDVSPTKTKLRLTFLLTRLQEALYEDLAV